MIDQNSLWIGDHVQIIKSGRIGIYEGVNPSGKARVRIDDKIIITAFANIRIAPVVIKKKMSIENQKPSDEFKIQNFSDTIDLHIDVLAPELENQLPQVILNKQLKSCTSFVEHAIDKRLPSITIIHGVGTGQLKREVHHILDGYDQMKVRELIHQGGATFCTLVY